jgi:hypothetical protein
MRIFMIGPIIKAILFTVTRHTKILIYFAISGEGQLRDGSSCTRLLGDPMGNDRGTHSRQFTVILSQVRDSDQSREFISHTLTVP